MEYTDIHLRSRFFCKVKNSLFQIFAHCEFSHLICQSVTWPTIVSVAKNLQHVRERRTDVKLCDLSTHARNFVVAGRSVRNLKLVQYLIGPYLVRFWCCSGVDKSSTKKVQTIFARAIHKLKILRLSTPWSCTGAFMKGVQDPLTEATLRVPDKGLNKCCNTCEALPVGK